MYIHHYIQIYKNADIHIIAYGSLMTKCKAPKHGVNIQDGACFA